MDEPTPFEITSLIASRSYGQPGEPIVSVNDPNPGKFPKHPGVVVTVPPREDKYDAMLETKFPRTGERDGPHSRSHGSLRFYGRGPY